MGSDVELSLEDQLSIELENAHNTIKHYESGLTAIAAALGCPDAEPGELAGMVADLKEKVDYNWSKAERYVVRIKDLEMKCDMVVKERDEYKEKFHECVAESYSKAVKLTKERDELRAELNSLARCNGCKLLEKSDIEISDAAKWYVEILDTDMNGGSQDAFWSMMSLERNALKTLIEVVRDVAV